MYALKQSFRYFLRIRNFVIEIGDVVRDLILHFFLARELLSLFIAYQILIWAASQSSRSDDVFSQVGVGGFARKLAEGGARRKPATRRKRCLHSLKNSSGCSFFELLITAE